MSKLRDPWTRYRITNDNSEYVDVIGHVCHIQPALRIIHDQKIKPGLVTETEVLKDEKVLGLWIAPNNWHNGSRYSHVCFYFPIENLFKRKRIYWLEAMSYLTPVCRFLVTTNNYDQLLKRYSPESDDGPLIFEKNKYYWNKKVSLQLLFDASVSTAKASNIVITKHHSRYCCLENPCPEKEKGMANFKVGPLLVSYMIAHDFEYHLDLFTFEAKGMEKTSAKPHHVLSSGVNHILNLASRAFYNNSLGTEESETIEAIIKASMIHLANNDTASFRKMVGILAE